MERYQSTPLSLITFKIGDGDGWCQEGVVDVPPTPTPQKLKWDGRRRYERGRLGVIYTTEYIVLSGYQLRYTHFSFSLFFFFLLNSVLAPWDGWLGSVWRFRYFWPARPNPATIEAEKIKGYFLEPHPLIWGRKCVDKERLLWLKKVEEALARNARTSAVMPIFWWGGIFT